MAAFFLAAPASANAGVTLSLGIAAMAASAAVTLLLFLWAGSGLPGGPRRVVIGLSSASLGMAVLLAFAPLAALGVLLLIVVTLEAAGAGVSLIVCGLRKGGQRRAVAGGLLTIAAAGGLAYLATLGFDLGSKYRNLGNLGAIRSALSVYYGDMGGAYPADLDMLSVGGKYLRSIPASRVEGHGRRFGLEFLRQPHGESPRVRYGNASDDAGGWLYDNTVGDDFGGVLINCTHTDWKGTRWDAY